MPILSKDLDYLPARLKMASNDNAPDAMAIPSNMTFGEMRALMGSFMKETIAHKQKLDCKRNGTFVSGLSSKQLEGIFWGLFAFVIVLLGAAATSHAKSETIKK